MRIRIRILDPHLKKMDPDPDPEYFFKIYWIFLTKQIFFAYFHAKTWWTISIDVYPTQNTQGHPLNFFHCDTLLNIS